MNELANHIPVSINFLKPVVIAITIVTDNATNEYSYEIEDGWMSNFKKDFENANFDIVEQGSIQVKLLNYSFNKEICATLQFKSKKLQFTMADACVRKILNYVKRMNSDGL